MIVTGINLVGITTFMTSIFLSVVLIENIISQTAKEVYRSKLIDVYFKWFLFRNAIADFPMVITIWHVLLAYEEFFYGIASIILIRLWLEFLSQIRHKFLISNQ